MPPADGEERREPHDDEAQPAAKPTEIRERHEPERRSGHGGAKPGGPAVKPGDDRVVPPGIALTRLAHVGNCSWRPFARLAFPNHIRLTRSR